MRARSAGTRGSVGTLGYDMSQGQVVCSSCGGSGVIKDAPNDPGGTNPTPYKSAKLIGCTSCAGKGTMQTHYPL
jgi:hypothetical protein